jgi:hypothetical protein
MEGGGLEQEGERTGEWRKRDRTREGNYRSREIRKQEKGG